MENLALATSPLYKPRLDGFYKTMLKESPLPLSITKMIPAGEESNSSLEALSGPLTTSVPVGNEKTEGPCSLATLASNLERLELNLIKAREEFLSND